MSNCSGNCSACSGCSGCNRALELTQPEIDFLISLGQIPFQPVVRQLGEDVPIYPGKGEELSIVLQFLEKKGLVSLDYDCPLNHFDEDGYSSYPIRGSIALTARGQQVLDLIEYQGID